MAVWDDDEWQETANEPDDPAPVEARPKVTQIRNTRRTPYDETIEAAILGCALFNDASADAVAQTDPSAFYVPSHRAIAETIRDLRVGGEKADPPMVVVRLKQTGYDAYAPLIVELANRAPAGFDASRYMPTFLAMAKDRKLLIAADQLREAAYEGDEARQFEVAAKVNAVVTDAITKENGPFETENVAAVVRGDIEGVTPTILYRSDGNALIYPGMSHIIMSRPGLGKTWVGLYAAAEVLMDGGNVLYLDYENTYRMIGSRLRDLGVPAENVEINFIYPGRLPAFDPAMSAELARVVEEKNIHLVVVDGLGKSMARQGLDEDRAPDFLAWNYMVVEPALSSGAAVLILDHITKEASRPESKELWARGSGAKMGEVAAAWTVRGEGFSRKKAGSISLQQAKDREGYNGTDGDTVAVLTFTPNDGLLEVKVDPPTSAPELKPELVMESISLYLERLVEPVSKTLIRKEVKHGSQQVDSAIGWLIKEQYIRHVSQPRKGYQSIRKYRAMGEAD